MNIPPNSGSGIVQIYLPASDLYESSDWYVTHLGFKVQFENEIFVTLRHDSGPGIMLRKTSEKTPVHFKLNDRVFPAISIKLPAVSELFEDFSKKGLKVFELMRFGDNDRYIHFHIQDPYGNKLDIGNYPDYIPG